MLASGFCYLLEIQSTFVLYGSSGADFLNFLFVFHDSPCYIEASLLP